MKPIPVSSFLLVVFVWCFFYARPVQSAVPTGIVKIRSCQCKKHLATLYSIDEERRSNMLRSDPEKWSMVQEGSYYRITLKTVDEDLYAFDEPGYDPATGKRKVFTWIPWIRGFAANQGKWEIKEACKGWYTIRNLHFDEYLYSSCGDDEVYTRPVDGKPNGNSMYMWQITLF